MQKKKTEKYLLPLRVHSEAQLPHAHLSRIFCLAFASLSSSLCLLEDQQKSEIEQNQNGVESFKMVSAMVPT
jgi:hypothetical protein